MRIMYYVYDNIGGVTAAYERPNNMNKHPKHTNKHVTHTYVCVNSMLLVLIVLIVIIVLLI